MLSEFYFLVVKICIWNPRHKVPLGETEKSNFQNSRTKKKFKFKELKKKIRLQFEGLKQ